MGRSRTASPEGLTTVHVAQGMLQAHVVRAMLEEAGIPVLLAYESIGPVMGITVDGVGEVRVQVAAEDADAARELIASGADEVCTGDAADT